MPKGKRQLTPSEKAAQHRRTKNNKIRNLRKMLDKNPNNEKAKEHLEKWEKQAISQ